MWHNFNSNIGHMHISVIKIWQFVKVVRMCMAVRKGSPNHQI